MLQAPASTDDAWQRAERVSAAARRLLETEADVRWVTGLEAGLILHPDEGRVEINPRLVELLETGRADRKQEIPIVPVSRPPFETQGSEAPSPLPVPSVPRPQSPPLRSHEPPPGHANSSSDCDCDCDVVDFRCSIEPPASDSGHPFSAMSRQLFVLGGLFALL
ncbi:MAG TPA: hypothetical protein VEX18_08475, partial [Polyangiaceae bacterium]|nr:hypothetical protein [Polyangiaceae bacterium]